MNTGQFLAGLDAGHINTKAVIMQKQEILGFGTIPTGFDVVAAAQAALDVASEHAGISREDLSGIIASSARGDGRGLLDRQGRR